MNSRDPEEFEGDLQAMVACLNVGTRAVERSIAKFGATALKRAVATRLAHAENCFRRILNVLPEKLCEGESVLEQDGHGRTESEDPRVASAPGGATTRRLFQD